MTTVPPPRTLALRTTGIAAATLAVTALAAYLTSGPVGPLNEAVEGLSSWASNALGGAATWLPFGFAFGAGMVSAVNPCGFAMLPAYLGLYLSADDGPAAGVPARLARALAVGTVLTLGFVSLFGVVGATILAGARSAGAVLPWLGFATGVALILAGAFAAAGGTLYASAGERLAHGVASPDRSGFRGWFAFGVAYGLASLSCTLPIFLAVIGSGMTIEAPLASAAQLLAYGLGMGLVVTAATVVIALFRGVVLVRVRSLGRFVAPVGTILLLVAGAYVVYYWWTFGRLAPWA